VQSASDTTNCKPALQPTQDISHMHYEHSLYACMSAEMAPEDDTMKSFVAY